MKAWIGKTFMVVGVGHTFCGIFELCPFYRSTLTPMLHNGLVNSVRLDTDPIRGVLFWFFFAGFMLLIIGNLVDRLERLHQPLPSGTVWGLAGLTTVCILIMPNSGFWLLIPGIIGMIYRNLRKKIRIPQ
jgi:hypothetical protein